METINWDNIYYSLLAFKIYNNYFNLSNSRLNNNNKINYNNNNNNLKQWGINKT
jgi:hypothetical protein